MFTYLLPTKRKEAHKKIAMKSQVHTTTRAESIYKGDQAPSGRAKSIRSGLEAPGSKGWGSEAGDGVESVVRAT